MLRHADSRDSRGDVLTADARLYILARMHSTQESLSGWGRSSRSTAQVFEPAGAEDVLQLLKAPARDSLIARGAGRSYGDTAINHEAVMRMTRMNAIHEFNSDSGEIVVSPGVTFAQLIEAFMHQGWIAPVTPGTQFATIGGAIANDVHGKNHDTDGSFGDHLAWLELALPDGSLRRVDTDTPELLTATIGGIGLTGVITRACFRMKRISGCGMIVRERRMRHFDEYFDTLLAERSRHRYSVGWIDGIARGGRLGRGVFETAEHADGPWTPRRRRSLRMPFDLPQFAMNSLTVGCFNELYFRRIPNGGRTRKVDLERFFYPLDSIRDWHRMYGRRGFVQFQCVLPDEASRRGIRTMLELISGSGLASFLAVIKTLGRAGRGLLSFPMRGITLALDFPMNPRTAGLMASLHAVTIEHAGRVYLAKDSCVSAVQLRKMYPLLGQFLAVRRQLDPRGRLRSDMSDRLQL
jgi:decaprenylphospho-beta-D-ribofuranose 2-oxidase